MASQAISNPPILKVDNLSKHFGGVIALDSVSFEVPKGRITSVIGPNGAGKTTLFAIIAGILKPTSGSIEYKNQEIAGQPAYKNTHLGMAKTFQNLELFADMNVLENVIIAASARNYASATGTLFFLPNARSKRRENRARAEDLLAWVGIYERRFDQPSELPYGDQRRLEIARTLATEPDLILLDEPAAGMTSGEAEDLIELIQELTEIGKTVLLIEHNMNLVMSSSHKVVVLNFGEVIADGPPKTIQESTAVISAYLGDE